MKTLVLLLILVLPFAAFAKDKLETTQIPDGSTVV